MPSLHPLLTKTVTAIVLSLPLTADEPAQDSRIDDLIAPLSLPEDQNSALRDGLARLHTDFDAGIWPQALADKLDTDKGVDAVRDVLREHGFVPAELEWLAKLPDNAPAQLRTSLILLNARHLLRHGPPELVDQWSKWNEGDTPGELTEDQLHQALDEFLDAAGDEPGSLLDTCVPDNRIYSLLHQHFVEMRQNREKLREQFVEIPPIKDGDTVKPGEKYEGAEVLSRRLAEEGFLDSKITEPADTYTDKMSEAVKSFQRRNNRSDDGILGPNTLTELNRDPDEKLAILRLNLHRARLIPDEPGERYLIVNIPSSRVIAFTDGEDPELDMKVIVGAEANERRTPVFRDVMKTVEFRPFWNIPVSIARDEIVPKARDDHGYLARKNFEIVSSYEASETISVSSGSLSKVEQGELLLRERPGPHNSLGQVKFLFANDYAIYLHDTPKDELFDESQRDFSHGCIRVERPADLAAFVLGPQGWDEERISEALESGETQPVSVEEPVNVYIIYMTAFPEWQRDDRKIGFFPDLYERDTSLSPRTEP